MALSGSFYSYPYIGSDSVFGIYCEWSGSQNVSENYTNVTLKVYLKYWSLEVGARSDNTVSINGVEESYSTPAINHRPGTQYTRLLKTYTVKVSHNSDGTKSCRLSTTWPFYGTYAGTYVSTITASATVTLDTIPRASSITSAGNITLGNACNVKWTPASSGFKYKLKFSLSSWSYTTDYISPNTTSAYTYTGYKIPASNDLYKLIPSSSTGTMSVTLTTYNSSNTKIGSTSAAKTFTVTIPSSVKPSIGTTTLDPVNITTKDGASRNILVKGKNKITVSVSGCTAGAGSSIKSYTFDVLSGSSVIASTTTTSTSATFGPFSKTGSLKFRVTVTDNRTRSTNNSGNELTETCYDYSMPSFNSFNAYRANSDGTSNMNGTYIKCTYDPKYSSVNSTNNATVTAYYNGQTATGKSGSVLINLNGDVATTYNVYLSITDNYNGTNKTSTITVFGQSRILNITSDGTGVAIGKMAESNELFECRWPAKFDDKINFGDGIQGELHTEQNSSSVNIVYLMTGQDTSANVGAGLAVHNTSVYVPNAENSGIINLGSSGRKWNQLYAANSTISTSDKNKKKDIENMSYIQEQLHGKLKPVTYKMIDGTGDRIHYGFIAQDVEDSLSQLGLTGQDFAGFCKDLRVDENGHPVLDENKNKIYDYSLRYAEFIALNTYMIQKLQAENTELKAELQELRSMIVANS